MKRLYISFLALVFLVGLVINSVAQEKNTVNSPEILSFSCVLNQLINSPSKTIPTINSFTLPAKLECTSCCGDGEAAYQECRRTRATLCDCLWKARQACINAGCGPCQCCEDWNTRGTIRGCWE